MSRFKLGFAPITWNNEDLRTELGPFVPYETLLDEVVAAGYQATELGDGFPREPTQLRGALNARSLAMPSAWCGLGFFQVSPKEDLDHTRRLCDFLAESGASYVNLAHYGSPERMAVACRAATASETPRLTPGQWDELAQRVGQAAEIARDAGLQAAFHLHAGTWIETRAELTELLERVPAPLLKLCWDVGHAICGGIDPVEVVRAYPERIAYLHLKDVDGDVLAGVRRDRVPFADAVRKRVFTELGSGILDVPGLLAALAEIDYAGWLMVEQDSTWLAPIDSARTSRAYLASLGV